VEKQRVAIIGAGKVGSVLARALVHQRYRLTGIASRTLTSAEKLAKEFGVVGVTEAADITKSATMIVIATPDRCIREVVEKVAQAGGFRPGQYLLHTSGATSVDVLCSASQQGVFIGSIHPLQSFASTEGDKTSLVESYFAVGGDIQAVSVAEDMVKNFGGHSFTISDQDRPLYHAAACIASNYLVSLMHWSTQIYARFGLSSQQATAALMPLVEGTIRNIKHVGPTSALTGPISRGDDLTIAAHLGNMVNQHDKTLYAQLALYTLGVAVEQGTIDGQQTKRIETILNQTIQEGLL